MRRLLLKFRNATGYGRYMWGQMVVYIVSSLVSCRHGILNVRAAFDSDDCGTKSRQPLESHGTTRLFLNRRFYCESEVLIG